MSRYYEMTVEIRGYDNSRVEEINAALAGEWEFDEADVFGSKEEPYLLSAGRSSLCGGESEDEFAERTARAVMKANAGPCEVTVMATYLEELPYETYVFGEEEYSELIEE